MPKRKGEHGGNRTTFRAYAKLNLTLDILGRRSDGYHTILSVMQTIDLSDRLAFTMLPAVTEPLPPVDPEASPLITLRCGRPSLQSEANLVVRAAEAMWETLRQRGRVALAVDIDLYKHIPVAAGLGGGSSDAARTLIALNQLWKAGLSLQELSELAATLGSDVPFFLRGGTMLAEGRGELLTPLPAPPPFWVVVLRPPLHIPDKTRMLYSSLEPADFSDGQATRALVALLRDAPTQLTPSWWQRWPDGANTFASVWRRVAPRIEDYFHAMQSAGAPGVLLSGAGPALYTLVTTENEAHSIQTHLREHGLPAVLARFVN